MDTRTQQDAVNEWYKPQNTQTGPQPEQPKTYTRAQQLFDAAQWEAEYGDDERKPFFFALCERLLEALKHD